MFTLRIIYSILLECLYFSYHFVNNFYCNQAVTVRTAMLKRLRFIFKAYRVQPDAGKFPRCDAFHGCVNGKTLVPACRRHSTQTIKHPAQVVLLYSQGCQGLSVGRCPC